MPAGASSKQPAAGGRRTRRRSSECSKPGPGAMPNLRRLFDLVVRPVRGRAAVDQEIAFHLERATADLERRGFEPDAAWAEALRQFGDVQRYREALVTIDSRAWQRRYRRARFGAFSQGLMHVIRGLRQSPSFVAGVALTLALG